MIFKYAIYDYIIETNRFCKYLKEINEHSLYNKNKKIIKIKMQNIHAVDLDNNKLFKYKYTKYELFGSWENINFHINFPEYSINISCNIDDDAYLFILNIPLSILLAYDNKLIFHSSNVLIDGNLYSFSGPKGTGKSTIAAMLAFDSRNATLFSDDTVCIDVCNAKIYSNYYVEKYTKDTLNMLNYRNNIVAESVDYKKNKFLKPILYSGEAKDIWCLQTYYLYRGEVFQNKIIPNTFAKTDLFTRNIVGINYVNEQIRNQIDVNIRKMFEKYDLKCKIIFIPEIDASNIAYAKTKLLQILTEK